MPKTSAPRPVPVGAPGHRRQLVTWRGRGASGATARPCRHPVPWSLATDRQRSTRAICDRSATWSPKEPTRATWTNPDPPSGRLAGLSADDLVLGGRLGRGHRAAQPATAITQRPRTIPSIVGDDRRHEMRMTTKRRATQLALVTVAAPIAGWALEQAAHRAEARDQASPASRRLRQGADFVQRFGRGPLADRLRQRPVTTVTWREQPLPPDQHHGWRRPRPQGPGSRLRCCHAPGTQAQSGVPGAILGADRPFMGWPDGQPAPVGNANPRRPAAAQPLSAPARLL
jgi:hypothetical protein